MSMQANKFRKILDNLNEPTIFLIMLSYLLGGCISQPTSEHPTIHTQITPAPSSELHLAFWQIKALPPRENEDFLNVLDKLINKSVPLRF